MTKREKERLKKKANDAKVKQERRIEAVRTALPMTLVGAKDRACGECQACCHVIAVQDVTPGPKPNYTDCAHQCEKGCGVYHSRPPECKTYQCAWHLGALTNEEHRPDKLGVIIDARKTNELNLLVYVFWEVWPNAFWSEEVQKLVKWIRSKGWKVMYNEYGNVGDGTCVRNPIF